MSTLDLLQHDHASLTQLLRARRAVSIQTMKTSETIAWELYLALLEEALNTLDSLIEHLTPDVDSAGHGSPHE